MIYVLLASALALWALYYVAVYAHQSYRLSHFTGPLAFPLVGNLYTAEAFQVRPRDTAACVRGVAACFGCGFRAWLTL